MAPEPPQLALVRLPTREHPTARNEGTVAVSPCPLHGQVRAPLRHTFFHVSLIPDDAQLIARTERKKPNYSPYFIRIITVTFLL
jgi:hypothetical protein